MYLSHWFADAGRHVRTMKFVSITERYAMFDRSVRNSRKIVCCLLVNAVQAP